MQRIYCDGVQAMNAINHIRGSLLQAMSHPNLALILRQLLWNRLFAVHGEPQGCARASQTEGENGV